VEGFVNIYKFGFWVFTAVSLRTRVFRVMRTFRRPCISRKFRLNCYLHVWFQASAAK